jgi:FlaG/FlaF family flagellin (archaellin)
LKGLQKGHNAVSEIIGNLLVLAITVTMFSGVLVFVMNMPPPQDRTISDFNAQTGVSGTSLYVNITHEEGQPLSDSSTNIYVFKNDVSSTLNISSSTSSIGQDWNIGEVWSYIVPGYDSSVAVRIMIVDKTTNSIVWQTTLAGTTTDQNTPPIIAERGLMPSPVYDQDLVHFFVTIPVKSTSVKNAWVDASSLGLAGNIALTDPDHDGTFTSIDPYTASYSNWNGRTIIFSVNDNSDNNVIGQFIVTVSQNPSGPGGSMVNGANNTY